MDRVLLLPGPALGHLGRLSVIIEALKERVDVAVDVVVPGLNTSAELVFSADVNLITIPLAQKGIERSKEYATHVNALIRQNDYQFVLYDLNTIDWLLCVEFHNLPTVCVTNVFLTQQANLDTFQARFFNAHQAQLNQARTEFGLSPLTSGFDLYEADLVLLADPVEVVEFHIPNLPAHYARVGDCVWQFSDPKAVNIEAHQLMTLSMGSTGCNQISQSVFNYLQQTFATKQSLYVGSHAKAIAAALPIDFAFEMLPLTQVLARSNVVLSQGGVGSTYQSLRHGVPSCVYAAHKNQDLLGDTLEQLGVGINLTHFHERSNIVADASVIKANCMAMATNMAKDNGPAQAAELLIKHYLQ